MLTLGACKLVSYSVREAGYVILNLIYVKRRSSNSKKWGCNYKSRIGFVITEGFCLKS
jgi:hypothetical protein